MTFRRILIPTDFSTASEWVFDDAVRIAAGSGGELLILHVRRTRADNPEELRFPADPSLYEYAEQQELDRLRDRVRRANATLATRLIVRQAPDAGAEVCRVATSEAVDLIVIATHGRHHVSHLFVGSTTMTILKEPPAPVLSIRYGIRKRTALRRVVVPVHLQQTSHRALELAAREQLDVHLVTVCSDEDQAKAAALQKDLLAKVPNAKAEILRGKNPEEEILQFVTRVDADAVFINAAASPSERKIDLVRHSPVPVMVV